MMNVNELKSDILKINDSMELKKLAEITGNKIKKNKKNITNEALHNIINNNINEKNKLI